MKKIFVLMLAILVGFSACKKADRYDFEKSLAADFELLSSQYDTVMFCEAQAKYDKVITSEDNKVVWIMSAWNLGTLRSATITHLEGDYEAAPVIEVHEEPWLEDIFTDYAPELTLQDALDALMGSEIIKPESQLVVLRHPLWYPAPIHSLYIFGDSGHGFVQVDAKTGEVSVINDEAESEESEEVEEVESE